jgi:8-oxo-dGTP diphosphatase
MTNTDVTKTFGNRVRVRVSGIAYKDNQILLVNQSGMNQEDIWWSPPGGGVEFGETLEAALIREFKEETGLVVAVVKFLFVTEYLVGPLHAVEAFFEVKVLTGNLCVGVDPELEEHEQRISSVQYMTFEELKAIDNTQKHHSLIGTTCLEDLLSKNGYSHYPGSLKK